MFSNTLADIWVVDHAHNIANGNTLFVSLFPFAELPLQKEIGHHVDLWLSGSGASCPGHSTPRVGALLQSYPSIS